MSSRQALRWALALILFIPVCYYAGIGGLNYSGYCFDQSRFLSDDERIRSGIAAILDGYSLIRFVPEEMPSPGKSVPSIHKRSPGPNDKGTQITQDQLISYRDAEEFIAMNPDCCSFDRRVLYGESYTDFWMKIIGHSAGFFSAKYQIRYRDSTGQVQSRWTGISWNYTNCGRSVSF